MPRKPSPAENQPAKRRTTRRRANPGTAWRLPPLAWITGAGRPAALAPVPSRILSTTLPEAFLLAAGLKDAEIVAVESSPERAKTARTAATRRRLRNLRIEHAAVDQAALGELTGGKFDVVLVHDTLHRVGDVEAAFANLAAACAANGSIYASLRTPWHPSNRLAEAMAAFGLEEQGQDAESLKVRRLLAALGGFFSPAEINPVEEAGPHVGPASAAVWLDRASAAGLHVRASTLAAVCLPEALVSGQGALFCSFAFPKLLDLLSDFIRPATLSVVWAREPATEPPWRQPEQLASWRPIVRFLSCDKIQPLEPPWESAAAISVEIAGVLAPRTFTLSHYLLELVRRSDGRSTIADLMGKMPHQARLADLAGGLHFLHHTFIMELLPPVS